MSCGHKTFLDHTNGGERYPDGKLIWTCSNCGLVNPWNHNWRYYGNIECKVCWTASIDFVACSKRCFEELCNKHKIRRNQLVDLDNQRDNPRSKDRKPRKRRMTIREKAREYDRLVTEGKVDATHAKE